MVVRISSFGFLSDFGFRVSDFDVPQAPDFSEAFSRPFIFPCQNRAPGLDSAHLRKQERPAGCEKIYMNKFQPVRAF